MGTRSRQSARPKPSSEWKPWQGDEILEEVYRVRDELAREHGHDLNRIFAALKEQEKASPMKRAKIKPFKPSRVKRKAS
jgi:hypothetical protein